MTTVPAVQDGQREAREALEALLASRFSCRQFRAEPVPLAVQREMFALAQRTASWCNSQPWQLVVTQPEATARLVRAMAAAREAGEDAPDFPFPAEYRDVYLARRRECGLQLYGALGIGREDRAGAQAQAGRNFEFFGAPHAIVVTAPEALGVYGAVDCGGWFANLALAAQSLGIATVAQAAVARYAPTLRRELGIADDRRVVFGVSFGYADEAHAANSFRTRRAAVDDAVAWVER